MNDPASSLNAQAFLKSTSKLPPIFDRFFLLGDFEWLVDCSDPGFLNERKTQTFF